MRLDLTKYRDITPLRQGAVVDAFTAKTGPGDSPTTVCLKFFRPARIGASAELGACFEPAVEASMRGATPRVLSVLDHGATSEGPAVVLPFVPGVSMRTILELFVKHGEHVPVPLVVHVAREALEILEAHARARRALGANDGHGSISLSAVRVDTNGTVFLTEPGLWRVFGAEEDARRAHARADRYAARRVGSGLYQSVDDVFALGVVLHALLAGSRDEDVPPALVAWLGAMTASEVASRFPDASAARAALAGVYPPVDGDGAITAWLAARAHGAAAAGSGPAAPSVRATEARPAAPSPEPAQPAATPVREARSGSAARAPRMHAADKSRVVIAREGSLWGVFVVGLMLGFAGTMAYAFLAG